MKVYANVQDALRSLYAAQCDVIDDKMAVLRHDADTDVAVFAQSGDAADVFVRARVGSLEGLENPGDLCEAALQANLFWEGTGGATLSLNQGEMALYLTDRREADALADEERLPGFVEDFVAILQTWRTRLGLYRPEEEDETADDGKEDR